MNKKLIYFLPLLLILIGYTISIALQKSNLDNRNIELKEALQQCNQEKLDLITKQQTDVETNDNNTTTDPKPPEPSRNSTTVSTPEAEQKYVYFFLVSPNVDNMSGDISRYLVPVKAYTDTSLELTTENKIQYALQALLQIKSFQYDQCGLQNPLYASDLTLTTVTSQNGKYTIELEGKIVTIGANADAFIKPQIIKTIEQYTNSYTITLNGSAQEWRCTTDTSGTCK